MDTQMDDEFSIFDETDYSTLRIEMKGYLKEKVIGVLKITIGGSVPLNNKSNFEDQMEENKNDALSLKSIFNGLSISVKKSMGQCTSSKDLWLKIEGVYQDKEDNSIKEIKGKDSPKYSDYNIPSEVECSLTNEEKDIVEVCVDEEEELLKFKEKVLFELGNVRMEIGHCSISSEYLEKCINEVLEKYRNHIMELKKMLKEQEESKKTQSEEKEEEIKRQKNEIINQA
jgi:hypothetical protein